MNYQKKVIDLREASAVREPEEQNEGEWWSISVITKNGRSRAKYLDSNGVGGFAKDLKDLLDLTWDHLACTCGLESGMDYLLRQALEALAGINAADRRREGR